MNHPIILKGHDYSSDIEPTGLLPTDKLPFQEYFHFNRVATPENLGLFYNKSNGELTASRYAGVMPFNGTLNHGQDSQRPIPSGSYLIITPRFHGNATEMLQYIVENDDFYQSTSNDNPMITFANKKSTEWQKKDFLQKDTSVLFGTFTDYDKIKWNNDSTDSDNNNFGFGALQGIFEMMEFLPACQRVCQQNLKQQSMRREENLVGKMKGKLNLQKQIKHNITSGRVDRNYCTYNQMSIDHKENRILKYALHLIGQAKSLYPHFLEEEFTFCQRALAPVTLVPCNLSDFNGLKNNGVFQYYAPALESAKKIIGRISITHGENNHKEVSFTHNITPFFIQMDLLFEIFCRALVHNALKTLNQDWKTTYSLLPYQNKFKLFSKESGGNIKGFAHTHIPDLVILENAIPVAIIDAKYSALQEGGDRERTFQIMTYMLRLDCKKGGFMSPKDKNEEDKSTVAPMNLGLDSLPSDLKGFHLPVDMNLSSTKENLTLLEERVKTNLETILGVNHP